MHSRGVIPDEKWFLRCVCHVHEIKRKLSDFLINGLHALNVQRASVFDLAICDGVNYTTGPKLLGEFRILWVILIFRFVFGIEVVQVSKKLSNP